MSGAGGRSGAALRRSRFRNREAGKLGCGNPKPSSVFWTGRRRTGMYEPRSFAYSLSQVETGWRWSVYDEDGETVARGADASRDAAQAAVDRTLNSQSGLGAEAA
jgi:hypothetical protein